jgi:hypothetical protein
MEYHFPDEILAHIVSFAESVPIDTRLHFGVLPKRLIIDKEFHSKLDSICVHRVKFYTYQTKDGKIYRQHKLPVMLYSEWVRFNECKMHISIQDFNGTIGYKYFKVPKKFYYATSTDVSLDSYGPYDLQTGLLFNMDVVMGYNVS